MSTGAFSISFSTTKLGSLATGYRMSISGPKGATTSPPEGLEGHIIGTSTSMRRDYLADTVEYSDPMTTLLGRVVVFAYAANKIGEVSSGRLVLNPRETGALFNKLYTGDVDGFIRTFIDGDGDDVNLKIIPSRMALAMGTQASNLLFKESSVNQYRSASSVQGTVTSSMDILQTYLPALGMELYWDGGNNYTMEEPRILHPEKTKGTINKEDIIDMTLGTDLRNIPDIVIPSLSPYRGLGSEGYRFALVSTIATAVENAGAENFKIFTVDIPAIMAGSYSIGHNVSKDQWDLTTGVYKSVINKSSISSVFGWFNALGFASSMYGVTSGTVTCTYQPKIVVPASWYIINGTNCFVSEIRHEVTRFREVTILSIAGTEDSLSKHLPSGQGTPPTPPSGEDREFELSKTRVIENDRKVLADRESNECMSRVDTGKYRELRSDGKITFRNILTSPQNAAPSDCVASQRLENG